MKCSIAGCPGEYEAGKVTHTVRHLRHQGQIIVIDHVPADVCSVCGDVLLNEAGHGSQDRRPASGKTPTGKYGASVRVRVKALLRKISTMFPWRRALPKPDLKELLLAPEARTEALTPPREQHRHRRPPAFE